MNFVKAILLLDPHQPFSKTANTPAALIEVLGKTTLQRTIENLGKLGLGETVLLAEKDLSSTRVVKDAAAGIRMLSADASSFWRTAEQQFEQLAEDSSHILVLRLNSYVELNWEEVLQHHRVSGNKVTGVEFDGNTVDAYLINSSRRNDAAYLLRSGMTQSRAGSAPYVAEKSAEEYVNFLRHEADLRRLASDALHRNCKLLPAGAEIKPGIWAAGDSQIDKHARLVAPVFIGSRARVCPGAVITRGSSIERHTVIGNKTVVENTTILPYTHLGPGLDVSNAVIGERHIFHLQRNVCTPILDPKLVSQVPAFAGVRTLAGAAKSLSQIWRGVGSSTPTPAAESSVSYNKVFDSAKPQTMEVPEVTSHMAVARRYGNQ